MPKRKIKLELTEREYELLIMAMYEYGEICDGEADVEHDSGEPRQKFRQQKTLGLRISKRLDALSYKLYRQKLLGEK